MSKHKRDASKINISFAEFTMGVSDDDVGRVVRRGFEFGKHFLSDVMMKGRRERQIRDFSLRNHVYK